MATGEPARRESSAGAGRELPLGAVTTNSGRISAARPVLEQQRALPFSRSQLARLDAELTHATRSTGLHFSVYLGDLGERTREQAEQLHAAIGSRAPEAVLVAVSPGQRVVEVVTGAESGDRLPDRGCKLAVMSMVASFKEGDLADGLLAGLRMLADQVNHSGP